MDRRRSPRVSVHLPVQVWGIDASAQPFIDSAVVTNLSVGGIVLQGVRRRLRIGELMDVRLGSTISQFRVIWMGDSGDIGMENMTAQAFLPNSVLVHCSQAAAAC